MESPGSERKRTIEEIQDAQIGLLEWELEEQGKCALTGLRTRKFFESELERALKAIHEAGTGHHRSGSEPLTEISILFIDLDNFKQVNDTRGHLEGDNVLKHVAEILSASVRGADVVARFGGDEFYILLPRTDESEASDIANKILTNLRKSPGLAEAGVTASIGISSIDASHMVDSKTLIAQADEAAIAAKHGGKNRVDVYNEKSQI